MAERDRLPPRESDADALRASSGGPDRELSDELLPKVFAHSNDGIIVIDPDEDRILLANPRAAQLLGYSGDELLATPISRIHPDEMQRLRSFAASVFREGAGWTNELSCVTKSGKVLAAEISASIVQIDGRVCLVAFVRSVQQRREAESALRLSEERYRSLYDKTPVMMHSIDSDNRLVSVNEVWLRTLGYRRDEVLGRPPMEFLTEESRQRVEDLMPEFRRRGSIDEAELCFVKKSGEIIDVLLSAVLQPGHDHTFAFLVDVTERKRMQSALERSEQRLAQIVGSALDAIVTFELEERSVRLFNRSAEQMFKVAAREAVGRAVDPLLSPRFVEAIERSDESADDGGVARGDLFARRATGEEFPVEATISFFTVDGRRHCTLILRDLEALRRIESKLELAEAEKQVLIEELAGETQRRDIVGDSEAMARVYESIATVAPTDATVLILGDTGTGKELVARAIHQHSAHSDMTLVKVNCAALPSGLVESELFGHEKGAFTGALARKLGRFELADGGTIFLDEIGDLPLELQSKLLRVLQEGEFERVGGSRTITAQVRVIAATNRDLQTAIEQGRFRTDLYYRLNVFPILLPPLRDRLEDLPVLVRHFAMKHGARLGKKIESVSEAAIAALGSYDWPGNVRELENIVERAVIVARDGELRFDEGLSNARGSTPTMVATLDDLQREHIKRVLELTNGRISGKRGAAEILGTKPSTLTSRMKRLGIEHSAQRGRPPGGT